MTLRGLMKGRWITSQEKKLLKLSDLKSYIGVIFKWGLLCCLLSSCGFHLRGTLATDTKALSLDKVQSVYLAVARNDKQLYRQLKNDLSMSGYVVSQDAEKIENHLIIISSLVDRRVTGVDSNGRNNEFEITHSIEFIINHPALWKTESDKKIQLSKQQDQLNNQQLTVSRQFYVDSNDPIGKSAEEQALLLEMQSQLSRLLVNALINSINLTAREVK
jgi:outer membrane lipopolysaccharide assembly protein LptE/RlpB